MLALILHRLDPNDCFCSIVLSRGFPGHQAFFFMAEQYMNEGTSRTDHWHHFSAGKALKGNENENAFQQFSRDNVTMIL
ncbi:hypothetical protein IRJ41_008320 [Triplophysa rosa]|uniref:Uncharacterized protein n=1 Tax=Triplophysa rosa TaxID=992332 RepID=A0A9W7TSH4_TRIRA|nr:hypothetical protein IRJ41_008320 [Triplophysa rosa]